ncbi:MAG: hypothetical protein ACFE9D_01305 [Promethearchaeota archaeon]
MSSSNLIDTHQISHTPNDMSSAQGKDWLASTSFGGAFKRSIYLLRHQFRWLVIVFFISGFILSIILIPVNSAIATFEILITNELLAPVPDYLFFFDLLIASFSLGLVQNFVIFFGTFILGTFAVYHVLRKVPSLRVLVSDPNTLHFPILSTVLAALITAMSLTAASIVIVIVPVIQVLFFFIPIFLVLGGSSLTKSFTLSINFRVHHWRRILGALILSFILNLFAGHLGVTFYLNLETVLSLYGISLGLAAPFLLSLLTQIPVAMVAPLTPLFSVAFFAGARGAYREKQHEKYMHQQKQVKPQQPQYIPFEEVVSDEGNVCQHCGQRGRPGIAFCTQCGQPMEKVAPSS